MPPDYLERILQARVYDVAVETPLELAPNLSRRMGKRHSAQARGHAAGVLVQAAWRLQQDGQSPGGGAQARRHLRLGRQSRAGRGLCRAEARLSRGDRHAGYHAAHQDRCRGGARRPRSAARRLLRRRLCAFSDVGETRATRLRASLRRPGCDRWSGHHRHGDLAQPQRARSTRSSQRWAAVA